MATAQIEFRDYFLWKENLRNEPNWGFEKYRVAHAYKKQQSSFSAKGFRAPLPRHVLKYRTPSLYRNIHRRILSPLAQPLPFRPKPHPVQHSGITVRNLSPRAAT